MEMPDVIYVRKVWGNEMVAFETPENSGEDKYYHSSIVGVLKVENERCESNVNFLAKKLTDYSKAIDRLLAENESLKAELAKRQWQPIESAPKDGTEMLISDGIYIEKGIYQYCKFYVLNNGDYGDGGYGRDYDTSSKYSDYKPPTHWMPLPDAPEVK